jgi:pentatricopeptide repeat protein
LALVIQSIGWLEERQDYLERVVSLMDNSEKSVRIGGRIFEALIVVYGAQSSMEEALTTFRMITGRVDGPCLRAILFACSLSNPPRWEDAVSILHTSDIVEDSLGPGKVDQIALGNAIICCSKANEFQEALTLLQLYGRNPFDKTRKSMSLPAASLNSLIAACGRGKRPDLAFEVLGTMESRYGVRPDTRSYRNAAIACNKAQHDQIRHDMFSPGPGGVEWWECALSSMRRMREEGLIPDLATFSATISACEAAGEWQRALGVLQAMMDDDNDLEGDGTLLNLYCFNAAISACEKGEAWVEALELYERMLDTGIDGPIRPNIVTLNSLLVALENAGQKELARSKYYEGRKLKIVNPWRWTKSAKGESVRAMVSDIIRSTSYWLFCFLNLLCLLI